MHGPVRHLPATARALAAVIAFAVAACGPGDPPAPPEDPGGGDGDGAGGADPGAGEPAGGGDPAGGAAPGGGAGGGSGGDGGGGSPGVAVAWATVLGGAGDEWAQDVAAAPGGSVVALTLVGPGGSGRVDQLGLARLDASGREEWGRLYDVGAPVAFAADGALSTGPGGEVYLALSASCGNGCPGLGAPVNGAALLQLSATGAPRWRAQLPGSIASQPVVDPAGNVAVATAEGSATVVRSFTASGGARWQVSLALGQGDVSLAADAGGSVLVGRGSQVAKLGTGGEAAWSRQVGGTVTGLAGTSSGAVVVAAATGAGPRVLVLGADGADGPAFALPGDGARVLVEVGAGRRIGAVTGGGGCGATVSALDVETGAALWSRPVAAAGCEGSDLAVHAVTVTTSGAVVVAGALRGTVDLGGAEVGSRRADALLVGFGP